MATLQHMTRPILLQLLAMGLMGAAPAPQSYRLDEARSSVAARVAFFGLASKTAHFPRPSGRAELSPDRPDMIGLVVDIDARALTAPDPVTLSRLRGPAFFDVEHHPRVRFAGSRMAMTSPVTATIAGELTAKGVTRPVTLQVTFAQPPGKAGPQDPIHLTAHATINRRDFGMTAWPLIVGRMVKITIDGWLLPN